jgi:hypothetical protein
MSYVGARKQDVIVAVCISPDICLTPMGAAMVPVPYQIAVRLGSSTDVIENVHFNGAPVYVREHSVAHHVKGNEPGTGGGVISGINVGQAWAFTSSNTVRAGKRKIVREGDYCWMNCVA